MKTEGPSSIRDRFNRMADQLTTALGSLPALVGSVVLVVGWALSGPVFGFSDTWQLFINTTTTVITFWMVFVIQNSANRQGKATQLKLDELIRVLAHARNEFVSLDHESEEVLSEHEDEFEELVAAEAQRARRKATDIAHSGNGVTPTKAQRRRRKRPRREPADQTGGKR